MTELQPKNQCKFCGFPKDIGEHSSDCPNNENISEEVSKIELRNFTKEEKEEERLRLAKKIEKERQLFFDRKREIEIKIEKIRLAVENKTKDLDTLKVELRDIKDEINDKSSSLFNRILERSTIKVLEVLEEEAEPKIENLESEIQELLSIQGELSEHLQQKLDLDKLQQEVDVFYNENIDDFKADQVKKRVKELERLEKEEEMRKVENIAVENEVVFIHGIMDNCTPSSNSLLKEDGVSFETKVKLAISLEPTISTSTIQKNTKQEAMWSQMGLVLAKGRVEASSKYDVASVAFSSSKRSFGMAKTSVDEIQKSVSDREDSRWNELIVSEPRVAGMYLTENRDEYTSSVPDDDFFELAKELGLSTYYIKNGEFFSVTLNEESGELNIGELIKHSEFSENVKEYSDEEKEKIFQDVIEDDIPYRIESLIPEARYIASRNSGIKLYYDLQGDSLAETMVGDEVSAEELGINPKKENWRDKKMLVNDKLILLQEIVHPEGSMERYFKNGRVLYRQKNNSIKNISKDFYTVNNPYESKTNCIWISHNSYELDRELNNSSDYLESMNNAIIELPEKINSYNISNEEKNKVYESISYRLSFHLNGFSETAEKFGDTEVAEKAKKLAQKLLNADKYMAIIERRIDENGTFKISREDLE